MDWSSEHPSDDFIAICTKAAAMAEQNSPCGAALRREESSYLPNEFRRRGVIEKRRGAVGLIRWMPRSLSIA